MAEGRLTLHHLDHSQSMRILWLIEELNIDYDLKLYERLKSGPNKGRAPDELKKIHPLGKSPALVTASGEVLVESDVIAKYLINTYDSSKQFQGNPAASNDETRNDILCDFAQASLSIVMHTEMMFEITATRSPFFVRPIFNGARSMLHSAYTGPEFDKSFTWLEEQLGDQNYFMGSNPGRADFMLSWPFDFCVQRKYVDLKKFPRLEQWYARCNSREGRKRALSKSNGYVLNF